MQAPSTIIPAHEAVIEKTLAALAAIPKDRIFLIYLSDGPFLMGLSFREIAHHRVFPGQGKMKLKQFLKVVVADGRYNGVLTLETFNADHRAAPPKNVTMAGRRSILCLLSEIYDPYNPGNELQQPDSDDIELSDHDQTAPPRSKIPHYIVLPPSGIIYGLEFIEFVVSETKVEALGQWLEHLGIKHIGKHRTRNVFCYRSGQVTMLLNFDPSLHGKSLYLRCGITAAIAAIRVSNVASIIERANYLNYPVVPLSRGVAPGGHFMAVQAPDESFMMFIENNDWEQDFVFEVEGQTIQMQGDIEVPEARYSGIDYEAMALDRLSLDAFIVFYKSMFGMYSQSLWEHSAPYGMSKSRAMVSSRPSLPRKDNPPPLRFLINMFENRETNMGKFVHTAGGSIIHHLALATDDIFSLSEVLRKKHPNTHPFLHVPSYYYDEIRNKYEDLTKEFIERMKSNDILYDRLGSGEFLTLNTELFEERLFIEVCERRHGYEGFGAVNAELREVAHNQRRLAKTKSVQAEVDSELRGKKRRKLSSEIERRGIPLVVLVVEREKMSRFSQTGDILGYEYVVAQTWEELESIEGQVTVTRRPIVAAVEREKFLNHFLGRWEAPDSPISEASPCVETAEGVKRILINTVCAEKADPHDQNQQMSNMCNFEFYYTEEKGTRQEYTRFLSFILGLKNPHPHDVLITKNRSVVLPLPFPDVGAAIDSIDILTVGVDALELRVDLLQDSGGLPSIKYVGEQLMWLRQSTALPIIFTLRSIQEGGKFPLDDQELAHLYLRKAIQWGCEYLDVEILRIREDIKSQLFSQRGMTRIISTYCTTAETKFPWMSPTTIQIYQAGRLYGDVLRIFGYAEEMSDNHELEHFRSTVTKSYDPPLPLTAINMGEAGQLSRLLNLFMTPVTHSMIAKLSPSGQISVSEMNAAMHIIGQLPKRELYALHLQPTHTNPTATLGTVTWPNPDYASPSNSSISSNMGNNAVTTPLNSVALFTEKCLKELNLPYHLTSLHVTSENVHNHLQMLLRSPLLGSISFPMPLDIPPYLPRVTPAARAIGQIDTILPKQFSGTQPTFLGDNLTWGGIREALLLEFSVEAYRDKPALVLSTSERQAAAAMYALRSVGVSHIYTIGFSGIGQRPEGTPEGSVGISHVRSWDELAQKVQPFVMISVLTTESASIVVPVLENIARTCEAQKLSRTVAGRIYVEVLSNFPVSNPNPLPLFSGRPGGWGATGIAEQARRNGWTSSYPAVDIQAAIVTEKFRQTLGQHVSYGFMRMAAVNGLY